MLLIIPACIIQKEKKAFDCKGLIPENFYVRMETNPESVVLDTRIASEYAEDRVPGARFAGRREKLEEIVDSLNRSRPVLIYCEYEDRSNTVCRILKKEKHFENVFKLKGGYTMWKKVNMPVDTSRRKIPETTDG